MRKDGDGDVTPTIRYLSDAEISEIKKQGDGNVIKVPPPLVSGIQAMRFDAERREMIKLLRRVEAGGLAIGSICHADIQRFLDRLDARDQQKEG